jgi:hypothetical protein
VHKCPHLAEIFGAFALNEIGRKSQRSAGKANQWDFELTAQQAQGVVNKRGYLLRLRQAQALDVMDPSGIIISEKTMAASKPKRRSGCRVTSQASSGVRHRVKKSTFSRTARYSGRYRPACRMIHTGGGPGTASPRQARKKRALSAPVAVAGEEAAECIK